MVLDDDGVEALGRRVDGSGEAGRSGANDNDVVDLFVGARVETDAVGQLCARKVEVRFVVVTAGPLGNRAVRAHEDGKTKAVGNPRAERTHKWVTIEIDPSERHPITTEEVAQVLHVRRVPTTNEIHVAGAGFESIPITSTHDSGADNAQPSGRRWVDSVRRAVR